MSTIDATNYDQTFTRFFDRLISHEGGYVNDPEDPGGETKWGISKRSYPQLPIKDLTREDAKRIYYLDFWQKLDASLLSDGVLWQAFDFAVNSGIQVSIMKLQRALGVADDGDFGPISREAAKRVSESDLILRFIAERLDYMTRLKNWPAHGRGWARRMAQNLKYGAEDSD